MTDQELKQYCGAVTVPDREIMDAARRRQAELAKPPGSLANWRTTPSGWRASPDRCAPISRSAG